MKKSKRKPTKAERKRAREQALQSVHFILEDLVIKLDALGDFDANAPHIRTLAAAVLLLYRDRFL